MNIRSLLFLLALASSVAAPALAQSPDLAQAAAAPTTEAAAVTAPGPVAEPVDAAPAAAPVDATPTVAPDAAGAGPETGTIVFFRDKKFTGSAIRFKVREGETELGKLGSGTYFTVQAPVGRHEYVVHSEAKDVLALEIEPGETYYVLGSISLGVLAGRPNLSPSSQAAFDAIKGDLKDVTGQDIDGAEKKAE